MSDNVFVAVTGEKIYRIGATDSTLSIGQLDNICPYYVGNYTNIVPKSVIV